MPDAEVIAFHGWGFDASCWEGWPHLLGDNISFHSAERGYFGKEGRTPLFSGRDNLQVLFVHSMGLHFCHKNLFQQADVLIIFSGFMQFHPVTAQFKRRSRLILNQMMNRVQGDAVGVLDEFYENAFYPQEPWSLAGKDVNGERLLRDLKKLNVAELDFTQLKSIDKICILHGFNDAIVPRSKGRELYSAFHTQARYFEIKEAGHGLPFTHSEQCWQFIESDIRELID